MRAIRSTAPPGAWGTVIRTTLEGYWGSWARDVPAEAVLVRDGGFTEKHLCLADDLVPMPDDLSFDLAAIGTDACPRLAACHSGLPAA